LFTVIFVRLFLEALAEEFAEVSRSLENCLQKLSEMLVGELA
jgi:hypothetical protein